MKNTTEELLLAAQVLNLATDIRNMSIPNDLEVEEILSWKREHQPSEKRFIEEAFRQISITTDLLQQLRSAP